MLRSAMKSLLDALSSVGFTVDHAMCLFSPEKRTKLRLKGRDIFIASLIFSILFWLLVLGFLFVAVSFYFVVFGAEYQ